MKTRVYENHVTLSVKREENSQLSGIVGWYWT
jgi:hypothetical protein